MTKKVSIKDIARKVGVSTAAVSYVLNNKEKETKISVAVAQRIKAVAKQLNYQPNYLARSLKSGVTNTIGLIVEDISNPFFSNLASIIEKEAQKHGYTVIIGCHYEDMEKSNMLLQTHMLRQVDGIIITPVDKSEKQIRKLLDSKMPHVLVDRYFSKVPSNTVTINNFDISYQAVSHLIDQGYKNIGMVAFNSSFEHMNDRIEGYQQALSWHKIKAKTKFLHKVSFPLIEGEITEVIKKLLLRKDRPDSLFFENNLIAIKALDVITEMKIKVPEELGLISFDERDAFNYFPAPITYIEQNLKEIGEQTLELLLKVMRDKNRPPVDLIVNARLVVRKSSILKN